MTGTSPRNTSPVVPSMEIRSPSSMTTPSGALNVPGPHVDVEGVGAAHAGAAHAAGHHGGVGGLAAAAR